MKAGWTTENLEENIQFIDYRGKTPPKVETGIRLITAKNVKMGYIQRDPIEFIDPRVYETWMTRGFPRRGDVLFTTEAPLGNVAQLDTDETVVVGQRLITMKVDPKVIDSTFLKYLLLSPHMQQEIRERATGATVSGIKASLLRKVPVSYPALSEQKRIVAVLDEAFDGLARARANAETNLKDARELFDGALFAVFSDVNSNVPKFKLSEVSKDFGRGRSRHRPRNDPKLYGGDIPFIQTGDIRNSDGIVESYSQTYSAVGLAQSKLWPKNTVCITIAANIAETAILGFPACFPDSVVGMVVEPSKAIPEYVELMLRFFSESLKAKGKGSAQDNINLATFEDTRFPFPTVVEQRRIVDKLASIAAERKGLDASINSTLTDLDTLRQSLLQRAFSGELT